MQGKHEPEISHSAIEIHPLQIDPFWISFGELFINKLFFDRGIVIVSTTGINDDKVNSSGSFIINGREFVFSTPHADHTKIVSPDTRALKKTTTILSILSTFALENRSYIHSSDENNIVLFNKLRREEIFLPVTFNSPDEPIGLYIYPWTTKPIQKETFSGFKQFVTAGCLFGASMRAITQDGDDLALIDHRIQLRPGQRIHRLQYDSTTESPFELTLLSEFEKTCHLINAFARLDEPKRLTYHLPAYDYILFGIELLIRDQMTFDALDKFIQAILLKQAEYQDKIGAMGRRHGIEIQFSSPFDNLFYPPDPSNPTLSLCRQLGLDPEHLSSKITEHIEQDLVQKCLVLLQTNIINTAQQKIWQDFITINDHELSDIESLFKIANAAMVATTSFGKNDHETCSLLPLSEKQIQIGYDDYCKKYTRYFPERINPYPAAINITLFEPVITYSPTTNGLLFYFSCCLTTLSSLISNKNISHYATKNVTLFSKSVSKEPRSEYSPLITQPSIDLISVLNRIKNPFEH